MKALAFTLIPMIAAVLGAAATVWRRPGPVLVSALQHFAAGVVFAAAAGEILPDLKHAGSPWPVLLGGSIGIAAMLVIRALETRAAGSAGLMALVGIDLLIDGLVLGLAFAAGEGAGILLTFALTLEVVFLGLTVALELGEAAPDQPPPSPRRVLGLTAALVLALPAGAIIAAPVAHLPDAFVTGFFAFGLVALLYLVTEELLVEAHEVPDRPWVTALFFMGFLLLLLLEEMIG